MATVTDQRITLTGGGDGQTAEDDGLSTMFFQVLLRNANNLVNTCPRHVLSDGRYPVTTYGAAAETLIRQWPVRALPGFTHYVVNVWGYKQAAAGTTTLRIYSDWSPLDDSTPVAADFTSAVRSASVVVTGATQPNQAFYQMEVPIVSDTFGRSYLMLTVENGGGAVFVGWEMDVWHKPLS